MKKIIIVGAGRLGKGFIGETFDSAGWQLSFVDKDPIVIDNLRKSRSYSVTVHRVNRIDHRNISNYCAYTYQNIDDYNADIINADVIALVIYPEDFADAIAKLSTGLINRIKNNPEKNLDILCLTNKNNLIPSFQENFFKNLKDDNYIQWFNQHVSLRDTIIRRATDAQNNSDLNVRTTAVLSLLIQKPLLVPLDDVEWMEECDNLALLKDLKVFMVNGPHVTAAFAGYLKGYKTLNETVRDPECALLIKKVHDEIFEGILRGYPITKKELDKLSIFPAAKGEMEDYVSRIAYDPIRKLAHNDRLTGIALVCLSNGIEPDGIAQSIANGFAYDNATDSSALQIQDFIKTHGIINAVEKYCGLQAGTPFFDKIIAYYKKINK